MSTTYSAAIMSTDTGGNESHTFEAAPDLFKKPADEIVDAFIKSLDSYGEAQAPLVYELNSAIKKSDKQIVMATGSIIVERGEIPFLVMVGNAE